MNQGSNAFFPPTGNMNMNFNMGFMMNGANGIPSPTSMMPGSFANSAPETPPHSTQHNDARFNRGNYRCSRCGEPKKGHVCPYQPANFKCNKCGNLKKSCTCGAPLKCNMETQCALDENMTVAKLDLAAQGVTEFHESVLAFVEGAGAL